jgi:hypothetical protein
MRGEQQAGGASPSGTATVERPELEVENERRKSGKNEAEV